MATSPQEDVYVQPDTLHTGIDTQPELEAPVPGLRVTWIQWDSGFRQSGLRCGDRITAVDGRPLTRPQSPQELSRVRPGLIGQTNEAATWKAAGAQEGGPVQLTVRRRALPGQGWVELELSGHLIAQRTYVDRDSHHRLYGPGGPDQMGRDDQQQVWSSWYEDRVREWGRLLADTWDSGGLNSTYELEQQRQHADRVRLLGQRYPGPFAAAVQADYEAAQAALLGRPYEVSAEALAYRSRGETLVADVAADGQAARAAFLQAHAGELLQELPAIDPILDGTKAVAGKLLELPEVTTREWIAQGPRTYFVFDRGPTCCFAEGEGAGMQRVLEARLRYESHVSPSLGGRFAVIGRIMPDPVLVVVSDQGRFGLRVEPVAATVGGACFVDVSPERGPRPAFAGEERVAARTVAPPADAPPQVVLETFFTALRNGDEELWESLFATWLLGFSDGGAPILHTGYHPSRESTWSSARRYILTSVYDLRVVWTDAPVALMTGTEFPGAPRIDGVPFEIDHVGRLPDGTYRGIRDPGLHRQWVLQRMDGGPWRITQDWGI